MTNRFLTIALFTALSISKLPADGTVIVLDLSRPSLPATFTLAANRIWTGTYSNSYPYIKFNNNVFTLTHLVDGDGFGSENEWGYWDGFTYSADGDRSNYGSGVSQSWVAHQFGNMAGGGIKTDAAGNVLRDANGTVMADAGVPYLVAYWGYYKILFGTSDKQALQVNLNRVYRAEGVYINNSPWPFYGNNGGDSFARPLDRDGDYFKLLIHGLDGNLADNGRTVEYDLARNTGGVLRQSPDWEWVDLSALGQVGGIYFTMESTDTDPVVGLNTAAYFCMDKLTVSLPTADVPVAGVSLNRTAATVNTGATLQLTATVLPDGATNRHVTWTSSNPYVASVSATGWVTALSAGSSDITVRTAGGGYTATCALTVSTPPQPGHEAVAGVSLNRTAATVNTGDLLQLTATVLPDGAANRHVTWASSNEAVATVFSDGQVFALSAGTATVTVRTADGGYTATCALTVKHPTGNDAAAPLHAVYPNPFTAYIMVETTRDSDATLCDLSGRIVRRVKLPAGLNRIETSTLPKGIYVLRYDRYTVKVIK